MIGFCRRRAPLRVALCVAFIGVTGGISGAALAGAPKRIETATGRAPRGPDVFGTVALAAGMTRYDQRWLHARPRPDDASTDRLIAGLWRLSRARQLAIVQARVNQQIAYRADRGIGRTRDDWASAAETLARSAGDCEDVAILKLQALRRLGFPAGDLYLSIGRDRERGDHALALVRLGDGFWSLDSGDGPPVLTDNYPYFEPVITLAEGGSWLHGHRIARR